MEKRILVCDECLTEKGQGNHWFVAVTIDNPRRLLIGPLGSEDSIIGQGKQVAHLCGFKCTLKRTSDFLDSTLKSPGGPGE